MTALNPRILRDILGLVLPVPVPIKVIKTWTCGQFLQAEDWASREHLAASDNLTKRKPFPGFLKPYRGPHG